MSTAGRRAVAAAVVLAVVGIAAGCTSTESGRPRSSGPGTSGPPSSVATSTAAPSSTVPATSAPPTTAPAPPPPDRAHRRLAAMTLAQRVGQLFMVDCPSAGIAAATVQAIQQYGVGAVILDGNSYAPLGSIAALTSALENANPSVAKLFIATDQEGGLVQRLRGPGFSAIPSAVQQGTVAPAQLQAQAAVWAGELRRAGVTVDLAPVLDTVPPDSAGNPPIGDLDREYGTDPATVASHGLAVLRALSRAGVAPTVKHFPGLGRVAGNTDTTPGVTDTVTVRSDPYLAPFAAAVRAGVPFVMMSTATYARIDPHGPAAFSTLIVTRILRGDLDFGGIVISDDVGQAAQVQSVAVGDRAVRFIAAGGDMVLTVVASQIPAMTSAVIARANSDATFRRLVDRAALRVLETKDRYGLLD